MRARVVAFVLLSLSLTGSARSHAQRAPSGPPSPSAVSAAGRRFLRPNTGEIQCQSVGLHEGEHRFQCEALYCASACSPAYRSVVIGFRGARVRLISRSERRGTDTGRCGCCEDNF